MNKGCIYYTDNRLSEPIFSVVQEYIAASKLPITSVSLAPIKFGDNYVLKEHRGYITMVKQIACALSESKSKYVFFCEHDVLYPLSHFDFTPERDDIYYYNANVWRWKYPENLAISYDRLISLSGLCVNRKFALEQYRARLAKIKELKLDQIKGHEPLWARRWGYEPGTKKIKRGGFSDDDFETWESSAPIVDIRHRRTFSPPKITLSSFKHLPTGWKETTIDKIPGWNLREIFGLEQNL